MKYAKDNGAAPSVAIVDEGGNLLYLARPETSFAAGATRAARAVLGSRDIVTSALSKLRLMMSPRPGDGTSLYLTRSIDASLEIGC